MLIDNRQIHSVHVNKIIDLALVGKTNSFPDLDNIPETFPPEEHTHALADSEHNGFMSSEDYVKLHNFKEFKYLKVLVNGQENTITASSIDDTLILEAGKNIVFAYDEATKILSFSVDYTEEEANLKGDPGDPGDPGPKGDTWRPIVDIDCNLSWEISLTSVPPDSLNIRGKEGPQGNEGDPAPTPTWENLNGKPSGNRGDTIFVKEDSSNDYEVGPLLIEGMFPNNADELNAYKALTYNYQSINDNWKKDYNTKSSSITEDNIEQLKKYWSITRDGITYAYNDINGYNFIMDDSIYDNYDIELFIENFSPTGAMGVVLASRLSGETYSTLSFVRVFNRDVYDLKPNENAFHNYGIVMDLDNSDEVILNTLNIEETLDSSNPLKFKIKITRNGDDISVRWTTPVLQTAEYPEYSAVGFDLNLVSGVSVLNRFSGKGNVGIGCIGQIFRNVHIYTANDITNTIYPIYTDEYNNAYRCNTSDTWELLDGRNVFNDIGVGRYIKDVNTEKLYYVKSETEVIFIKGAGPGEKMALVNIRLDTPITEELVS